MAVIGYHASHEQLAPSALIDAVQRAEAAGLQVLEEFRAGGGEGKPAHEQWRTNVFDSSLAWNLESPEQFDAAASHVTADAVREKVFVASDLGRHCEMIRRHLDLGFDSVYLHHVGQQQRAFIEAFGSSVLPEVMS